SQTGGDPTFSRSKEFCLPGVTVRASMNGSSGDRRPGLIGNAWPELSVPSALQRTGATMGQLENSLRSSPSVSARVDHADDDFKQSLEGSVRRAGRFDHMVGAKIDEQIIALHRLCERTIGLPQPAVRRDVNTSGGAFTRTVSTCA